MSMSADAEVFYGLVFEDDLEMAMGDYDDQHEYPDDIYSWGEKLKERAGVTLVHHGHHEYPHYGLAIATAWGTDRDFTRSGTLTASYGDYQRIDPLPEVQPNWEQKIEDAYFELAEMVGIASRIRPSCGWMLVASYG
jgi:hypothetical protein